MQIGIIGTGNIGGTLGRRWAAAGHAVYFGARDPQQAEVQALVAELGPRAQAGSIAAAVAASSVVLLAVPGAATVAVAAQVPDWGGRILIDATNGAPPAGYASLGQAVAAAAHGARVVKAFNTAGYNIYANPHFGAYAADLFLCGDDGEARATVAQLAQELGLDPLDVGDLGQARLLEAVAFLWIRQAMQGGHGREIAFKLLRR